MKRETIVQLLLAILVALGSWNLKTTYDISLRLERLGQAFEDHTAQRHVTNHERYDTNTLAFRP